MTEKIKVRWLSAGVSSFVASYLSKNVDKYIYIDIDDQHSDSMRFINDCQKALGHEIEILQPAYKSVVTCIRAAGMIKNPYNQFAPCTNRLKKRVRKEWEDTHKKYEITYVWGFDVGEKHRADRLNSSMPDFTHEYPLIDRGLSKQDCHAMLERLGIKRPLMYDMGYQNNNCVGCVRGGHGILE